MFPPRVHDAVFSQSLSMAPRSYTHSGPGMFFLSSKLLRDMDFALRPSWLSSTPAEAVNNKIIFARKICDCRLKLLYGKVPSAYTSIEILPTKKVV